MTKKTNNKIKIPEWQRPKFNTGNIAKTKWGDVVVVVRAKYNKYQGQSENTQHDFDNWVKSYSIDVYECITVYGNWQYLEEYELTLLAQNVEEYRRKPLDIT